MPPTTSRHGEQDIRRARQAGDISVEESFGEIYDLYSREVLSWLWVRVPRDHAEDIFQEVWSAFFLRWRNWEFREHLEAEEARPVLSFLFRTAAFAWRGHRRKQRPSESLSEKEETLAGASAAQLDSSVELGQCLDLATRICSPEEVEVLVARLSGLSGAEIAQALGISEAIADHRYRGAVARLRRRLQTQSEDHGQEVQS